MKASVKAAWVKDLRDNPDAQGRALLDYIDTDGRRKNCCLGRLCRLAVAAGVIPAPELRDGAYHYLDDREAGGGESFDQQFALPRKVCEWAGVSSKPNGSGADITIDPSPDENGEVSAIGANDGEEMSFAQIADLIEQNVPAE